MKKPTMIIRKKHIIMSCLTLMLGIAVYVNYATAPIPTDDSTIIASTDELSNENDSGNYGEIELVNGEVSQESATDYFAQARLDKMNSRDTAVQTLQTMIGGGDLTEDEMVTNAINAVEVSKFIECEGNIESLIKAQGFEDCVAYLDGESVKIVVKTEGLDKAQAAAIKEVILGETEVNAENIRIFEVK